MAGHDLGYRTIIRVVGRPAARFPNQLPFDPRKSQKVFHGCPCSPDDTSPSPVHSLSMKGPQKLEREAAKPQDIPEEIGSISD